MLQTLSSSVLNTSLHQTFFLIVSYHERLVFVRTRCVSAVLIYRGSDPSLTRLRLQTSHLVSVFIVSARLEARRAGLALIAAVKSPGVQRDPHSHPTGSLHHFLCLRPASPHSAHDLVRQSPALSNTCRP